MTAPESAVAAAAAQAAVDGYVLASTTQLKEMHEMPTLEEKGSQSRFYNAGALSATGDRQIVCRRLTTNNSKPCYAYFAVTNVDTFKTLNQKLTAAASSEHASSDGQVPRAILDAFGRLTVIREDHLINSGKNAEHAHSHPHSLSNRRMHAHAHAHAHAYSIYTHTHTPTCLLLLTDACTRTRTRTRTHMHTPTRNGVHMYRRLVHRAE